MSKNPITDKYNHFETLQLHAGQVLDETGARAVPIYQTTSYVFNDSEEAAGRFALTNPGGIYSRITNPTVEVLEQRVAELEGGTAGLVVASGSAAVNYSILNIAGAGDNIIASPSLYGGTVELFAESYPKLGIDVRFAELDDPEALEDKVDDNTKAVYLETIGNPHANLIDIDALSEWAHSHGLPVIVDNTFASPYLYRPFEHGADVVLHSATKFLGGHGTTLGGVITENGQFDWKDNPRFEALFGEPDESYDGLVFGDLEGAAFTTRARAHILRDTGACLSALDAFILLLGTETLSLRVERHVENAEKVAKFLEDHPKVDWVAYPGLESSEYHHLAERDFPRGVGSIFTFGVKGGREAGQALVDSVELFSHLANVGDAKSLIIHPATTTHAQLDDEALAAAGISQDMIRISIGLENADDLIVDLSRALDQL